MNGSVYLVAGLGKTGHSIAAYLKRRNLLFIAFDTRKNVQDLDEFIKKFPDVDIFLEELPASIYPSIKEIIASPGISLDEPFLKEAFRLNIPVIGDIECLARTIKHTQVIAITGTNGKSTVTSLVGEMASEAGRKVAIAGNIGLPVLDLVDKEHYDLWVLELSSFQLDLIYSLAPIAATILNISPDHLDRHHSLEAYISSKQKIYLDAQNLIYNRDDSSTFPTTSHNKTSVLSFGLSDAKEWGILTNNDKKYLAFDSSPLLDVDELLIKGKHNWQNALAACALATTVNIPIKAILNVLKRFSGLPHRCQWTRTVNQVDWVNDSKGTNIGAAISAIAGIGESIRGKIVLIAGGLGKGADFSPLRPITEKYTRSIILVGKDALQIKQALSPEALMATSFEEAILLANKEAKPGDVVLLSPACASQDMFKDFNHRGEVFMKLVGML